MTISSATNEVSRTVPVAIGTEVTFPMLYFVESDIVVIDNGTLKTLSTDYTLSAVGVDTGGTLTTVTAFSNATLGTRIIRRMPKTQLVDYQETGAFPAETHEDVADKLTVISQGSMSRDTTSAESWDAQSDKIINVTNPTLAQDAATKTYADNLVISSGNVPAPTATDATEERHLKATAANTFTWELTDEAPEPTSGQVTDKAKTVLRPNTATEGSHSSWDTSDEIPTPSGAEVTAKDTTVLAPNLTTLGSHGSFRDSDEVPLPTAGQVTRRSRTVVAANSVTLGVHGTFLEITTPSQNFLYNGDFAVAQKGTSFTAGTTPANSDTVVLLDRWVLLSDGNDRADITQETSVIPDGAFASIRFDVETVGGTSEKFGIVQILENRDTLRLLRDGASTVVSLSFEARTTSGTVENLRAGVLAWDSTADSPTRDVVSAWGAEGTNPTLVTNWTFENTPANLVLTNSFSRFTINNIALNTASTANLAVFIWVDDTDLVAGNFFYISKVKLERGDIDTPYQGVRFADDLAACQRYWNQSYNQGVAPNTVTTLGQKTSNSTGTSAGDLSIPVDFPVTMRTNPSVTIYNPAGGTTGRVNPGSEVVAATTIGESGFHMLSSGTISDATAHSGQYTADAEL